MASLLAARRQNLAATRRLHANAEAVRLAATPLARLISALWQSRPPFSRGRERQSRWRAALGPFDAASSSAAAQAATPPEFELFSVCEAWRRSKKTAAERRGQERLRYQKPLFAGWQSRPAEVAESKGRRGGLTEFAAHPRIKTTVNANHV
jgi:hypothetical protein